VSSQWIYKIKHATNGSIKKFKERFVMRGFSQKEGVKYKDKFSLVARYDFIRVAISIILVMRWRIHQMEVKTNFLNETIEEEVYIEKYQGFEVHGRESDVCRINKSLYGLKHVPSSCIPRLTYTCRVWALPRVRQILIYTSYLLGEIHSSWFMICFSQV
jgi:hypothetical protein